MALFILVLTIGPSQGSTIEVSPGESIQAAIDASAPGDIIQVNKGEYHEDIIINKALALKGIGKPSITSRNETPIILLTADGCTLEGFDVANPSGYGIQISSDGNIIRNNSATGKTGGIYLLHSHENLVCDSKVSADGWWNSAIYLKASHNNTIEGNDVIYSGIWGNCISLLGSSFNTLNGNKAQGRGWLYCKGISLRLSDFNIISSNSAESDGWGGDGICLLASDYNTLSKNMVKNNSAKGVSLDLSDGNVFTRNNIHNSEWGIYLYSSGHNILRDNKVHDCTCGIVIHSSGLNVLGGNDADDNRRFDIHFVNAGRNEYENNQGRVEHSYLN